MTVTGRLDAAELLAWLKAEGAHHDLVRWVETGSLGWPEAWSACPRGDWLIALAHRAGTPASELRRAGIALAALVDDEIEDAGVRAAQQRLRESIDEALAAEELADELEQRAQSADDLGLSTAYGILALVGRSHRDAALVAFLPAHLVELALAGAMDCAMMSRVAEMQRRTAEIVRSALDVPRLERRQGKSESTGSSDADGTQ